jgi:hypothetical protein
MAAFPYFMLVVHLSLNGSLLPLATISIKQGKAKKWKIYKFCFVEIFLHDILLTETKIPFLL